jgi:S-adenosylmethionine:tRNA ribosyltransferase-isomerase
MQLNDFHYELPAALIAKYPLSMRSASRLLCLAQPAGLVHRHFSAILDLVHAGDLMIFNDTRVFPARLIGRKATGGQVEILVERILDEKRILGQVRSSKALRPGSPLFLAGAHQLEVGERAGAFYELHYRPQDGMSAAAMIDDVGRVPLPPYIQRLPEEADKTRYQTVYARHPGSVAAPTAGLHFDEALLEALRAKKIDMAHLTLHIGAGTFAPVRVSNILEHRIHAEYLEVGASVCEKIAAAKARKSRVIAVGTTSLRALETAAKNGTIAPYRGETHLFIYPGYVFQCVDVLITNLHLPRSTLLMLVCAFGGHEKVMQAYQTAVAQGYRFYSYGDAMWVEREAPHPAAPRMHQGAAG